MKLSKSDQNLDQKANKKNPQPKKNKDPLNLTLVGLLLGLLLGLILGLGTCYFIYQSQIVEKQFAQLHEFTENKATISAQAVANYFESLHRKSLSFTDRDHYTMAVSNNDTATIEELENLLFKQYSDAISVSIFRPGEAALDQDSFPPLRFSELAVIRKAMSGEDVAPEAVKLDKQWLLHVFVAIHASKTKLPVGLVWISLGIDELQTLLGVDNVGLGQVSLYQRFGNNRILVTQTGHSDLDVSKVVNVAGTHWELEFAASTGLYKLTHVNSLFINLVMAAIVLLLSLLFSYIGLRLGREFERIVARKHMEQVMHAPNKHASGDYTDPMYQNQNYIDVEVSESDESLLGFEDDGYDDNGKVESEALSLDDDVFDMDDVESENAAFPSEVFRAYDIRGLAKNQITKEFALTLGKALGSELLDLRENTLVVARDARTHSPELMEYLIRGVLSTGCNVLNIGSVPTPLMYFTLETMDEVSSGVMITASHNDAPYNGFKMVINGVARSEDDIKSLRMRMIKGAFIQGQGQEHKHDIVSSYIDTIFSDVALAGEMNIVIDAANGIAGKVAPKLFEELGCRVTPLYCDLDGRFPNHSPDPSKEENLQDLIAKVKDIGADVGIALDGDGDRLTVVSNSGNIIWADRLLMLFAKDIISRSPGADVVFDVKSTRHLSACIANSGGRPIMWKTGHSLMKQKMLETGAVVGAEFSGHIFIKDRWFGFDDGMYAAARLLELLSLQGETVDEVFAEFPESLSTPEVRVAVPEERKFALIEALKTKADFGEGRLTLIDGVRVDFPYGWGLVRASNTAAELTLRFEADDEKGLHTLKALFVKAIRSVDNTIQISWNS